MITTTVADAAALLVIAAGLIAAAITLARARQIPPAIAVLLDFFTAAVLLRLASDLTWPAIGAAALTIVIRELASRALTAARAARHR